MIEPSFRWPEGFRPGEAQLYVRNTRHIAQPAAAVWQALVQALEWPSWYPNAKNVVLPDDTEELGPGMKFRWTQTGIRLDTEVREFEPGRRIAWFARSPWIQAYHAWEIQPDGDACFVVTDETQRGLLPRLFRPLLEPRMLAIHDRWLERLAWASGPIP
jgi:uncharacterized protein YndB with AHSA1/START domain